MALSKHTRQSVSFGYTYAVAKALRAGEDVNEVFVCDEDDWFRDGVGKKMTLLMLAIKNSSKREEMVRILIANGAELTADCSGETPLEHMIPYDGSAIFSMMVDSKQFATCSKTGALCVAVNAKKIETLKILLSRSLQQVLNSHSLASPLCDAVKIQFEEAVDLLLKYGASPLASGTDSGIETSAAMLALKHHKRGSKILSKMVHNINVWPMNEENAFAHMLIKLKELTPELVAPFLLKSPSYSHLEFSDQYQCLWTPFVWAIHQKYIDEAIIMINSGRYVHDVKSTNRALTILMAPQYMDLPGAAILGEKLFEKLSLAPQKVQSLYTRLWPQENMIKNIDGTEMHKLKGATPM